MMEFDALARARDSFGRQSAMTTIGAAITEIGPGRVTIAMPAAPHILQQHGFVHGGVIGMIADSACGYAALSLMPADKAVLTGEYKINFVSPAAAPRFEAVGRVIRAGRRQHVVQGEVFGIDGEKRKLVAIMLATMLVLEQDGALKD